MSQFEQEDLWRSARGFAEDKVLAVLFERMTEKYIQSWATSAPDDEKTRNDSYFMVRAIASLRTELTALAAEPEVVKFNSRLKRK
jgi:hypothetical protein